MPRGHMTTCIVVVSLVSNSGCGLLFVPYAVTLPKEPLRRVRVMDYDTHLPLPDASVSFRVVRHDNWIQPMPAWGVCDPSDPRTLAVAKEDTRRGIASWKAIRRDDGLFEIAAQTRCAWVQVWCPLPPVLGCFLYYTFDGTLIVSAPGHRTVWFSNSIEAACRPNSATCDGPDLPDGIYVDVRDAEVDVFLPRDR